METVASIKDADLFGNKILYTSPEVKLMETSTDISI